MTPDGTPNGSADRVANEALRAEYRALAAELSLLRARCEKLERSLAAARSAYQGLRHDLADATAQTERAMAALAEARAAIEGVSPAALGVARRLTAASARHPRAGQSVRRALAAGRHLRDLPPLRELRRPRP